MTKPRKRTAQKKSPAKRRKRSKAIKSGPVVIKVILYESSDSPDGPWTPCVLIRPGEWLVTKEWVQTRGELTTDREGM